MASPNIALSRSAFSDVILADRSAAPAPERPQQVTAAEGEVVLRLRVWWVNTSLRRALGAASRALVDCSAAQLGSSVGHACTALRAQRS